MYIIPGIIRSLISFQAAQHIPYGCWQYMQLNTSDLIQLILFGYVYIYLLLRSGCKYNIFSIWKLHMGMSGGIQALARKILQVFQRSQMQIKDFATFSAAVIFAHLRCIQLVAGRNQ